MRICFILVLLLANFLVASGQCVLSGYVLDSLSGEPLVGVSISDEGLKKGTASNAFGYYTITFAEKGQYKLHFSYVGYQSVCYDLNINSDTLVNVGLKPGLKIEGVDIKAERGIEEKAEVSTVQLSMREAKRLPALGGEVDLIKALQLLPGVSQGSEGSSGMYVRGGSPDQNLILLDDVPLYYVNHLGGFVSTFNPDAIGSVTLIKGGFPARYGSRLSSVLDVRMKNGNLKQFKGNATIGLVSSKVTLEGPLKKDTSSYIFSARRMMYDLLMRPLTPLFLNGVSMGYNFYDVNLKLNHKFSHKDRLYLSFYNGDDRTITSISDRENDFKSKNKLRWGNTLGAVRWNHIFGPKLFSNSTASYTQYRNAIIQNYEGEASKSDYEFLSKVSDVSLKTDFEIYPHHNYIIRAGVAGTYHHYQPTNISTTQELESIKNDSTVINYAEEAFEFNGYLENEVKLGSYLDLNMGLRYSVYMVPERLYPSLEPRLALNYRFVPRHSFKLGYSVMQQNVHLLTASGSGMPSDYWLPATEKLKPQVSTQYALGWAHTSARQTYEMSIEAYYKEMENLIAFDEGIAAFTGIDNWENQVIGDGFGISKGVEFFVKKKRGQTTGWLGYTLSKTTRQFAHQNNGDPYAYRYDRRHDISVVVQHQISPKIDFFASWVYNTGNAITLAKEQYVVPHEVMSSEGEEENKPYVKVELYDGRNNTRMKPYHRLDVGVNFIKKKAKGERVWRISIYNLYNRQNAYYYFWSEDLDADYGERGQLKLYQQTLFPIIPSVSYSFTF